MKSTTKFNKHIPYLTNGFLTVWAVFNWSTFHDTI